MLIFSDFRICNGYDNYYERRYLFVGGANIGLRLINFNPIHAINLLLDKVTRYNKEVINESIIYALIF